MTFISPQIYNQFISVVPSSTDAQRVVGGRRLGHPPRAHRVPAREGGGGGQPGPGLAGGESCGRAAADPVEPLAGEAGEEARAVEEARAAVRRGDGRPQVRFTVIPAGEETGSTQE